ncbi:MAG: DUF6261 family protein [Labilibaculum antarcticum]
MFENVKLSNLRNSEFIEFFKTFIQLVVAKNPEAVKVKEKFAKLVLLVNQIDILFKPELGNKITNELQEIDAARDNLFSGMELIIEGNCHHSNSEIKNKSELLWNSLRTYGTGIVRSNYQEETQVLDNITQRWLDTAEFTNALNTLSLTTWVSEIKTLNDLFRSRYIDRLEDEAEQSDLKAIDLRKQITATYQEVSNLLQAYATISEEAVYTQTIDSSNELIDKYNLLLKSRSTKQEETTAI